MGRIETAPSAFWYLVTFSRNKKPRIPESAPLGNLDSSSEESISNKPFYFQKQAGIHRRQLTYIALADVIVN